MGISRETTPGRTSSASGSPSLPDVVFDFLCETGTEVHTRVKISDETKTVQDGMLWTEESLPAETILAGVVACDRVFGRDGKDIATADLLRPRFATTETAEPPDRRQGHGRPRAGPVRVHPHGRRRSNERPHPQSEAGPGGVCPRRPAAVVRCSQEYVSFAKKFPALIHTCGLAQAVAFALAKPEAGSVRGRTSRTYSESRRAHGHHVRRIDSPSRPASSRSSGYLRLSRDAIKAATWLKRYVEATQPGQNGAQEGTTMMRNPHSRPRRRRRAPRLKRPAFVAPGGFLAEPRGPETAAKITPEETAALLKRAIDAAAKRNI